MIADLDLVEANVDAERVGENWRQGIMQLIEAHEIKHRAMASRKQIHVLLDRYAARYFPAVTITYADRRFVLSELRQRYFFRLLRVMRWRSPRTITGDDK